MQDVGKLLMGLGSGGADKKSSASIACFLGTGIPLLWTGFLREFFIQIIRLD